MGVQLSVLVTLVACVLMILAGIDKRALTWRGPVRRCSSCGRPKRSCRCGDYGQRRWTR